MRISGIKALTVAVTLACGIGLGAGPVGASDLEDKIIAQLQAQGYADFSVSRTLLGRLRILARQGGAQREIVVNPRTGEVLRDVNISGSGAAVEENSAKGPQTPRIREEGNSGGSNSGGDRRDDNKGTDDHRGGSNSGGDDSHSGGGGGGGSGGDGSGGSGGGNEDD